MDSIILPCDKINVGHAWVLELFAWVLELLEGGKGDILLYLTCKHKTVENSVVLKWWIYTELCI